MSLARLIESHWYAPRRWLLCLLAPLSGLFVVLSALRARNTDSEDAPFYVPGPEDGRNEWSYTTAKAEYWSNHNDAQAERQAVLLMPNARANLTDTAR